MRRGFHHVPGVDRNHRRVPPASPIHGGRRFIVPGGRRAASSAGGELDAGMLLQWVFVFASAV